MTVSVFPTLGETVWLVLDELGNYGPVWWEMADREANEANIIERIIEGRFKCPLRVVAFNTDREWSRDVTAHIASRLLDLSREGRVLGERANEFVQRVTGYAPIAVA